MSCLIYHKSAHRLIPGLARLLQDPSRTKPGPFTKVTHRDRGLFELFCNDTSLQNWLFSLEHISKKICSISVVVHDSGTALCLSQCLIRLLDLGFHRRTVFLVASNTSGKCCFPPQVIQLLSPLVLGLIAVKQHVILNACKFTLDSRNLGIVYDDICLLTTRFLALLWLIEQFWSQVVQLCLQFEEFGKQSVRVKRAIRVVRT